VLYYQPLDMTVEEAENKRQVLFVFRDHEGKEVCTKIFLGHDWA
jgi:hypothetical protein